MTTRIQEYLMTSSNMGNGYKTALHNGKKAISHNRSISGYQTAAKTGHTNNLGWIKGHDIWNCGSNVGMAWLIYDAG